MGTRNRIAQIGRSLEGLEPEALHLQREMSRIVGLCAAGGFTVALVVVPVYGFATWRIV